MAQVPRVNFETKPTLEEASKNWNNLPSILSMRLYEWIGALTHPKTGAFPNGISPRQLDRLAHNQIATASKEVGSELKPVWKSNNHLGVMLWNEVKAGRVVRLHKACYVGNFQNKSAGPSAQPGKSVPAVVSNVMEMIRNDRISSSEEAINSGKNTIVDPISESPKSEINSGESSSQQAKLMDFQCFACKLAAGDAGILKCIECTYQTHIYCAYANGPVPANLLKRVPAAVANWRCYDCKRCHLCGGKDDSSDGLLLCDGCDAGEHMRCQSPALNEVPPAPWYCTLCRVPATPLLSPVNAIRTPVLTNEDVRVASSQSALVIDEQQPDAESIDKPPRLESVSSPDCPSSQSDPDSANLLSAPAWPRVVKMSSPPLSDDTPELSQRRRDSDSSNTSSTTATLETKPIRTRLGKRETDGEWVVEGPKSSPSPVRRRYKRRGSSAADCPHKKMARSNSSSSSRDDDVGSRKSRKNGEGTDTLPFMTEDLPLLTEADAKNVRRAKLWTVEDAAAFMDHMGYTESAKAFKREEIDGAALLLLRRQDVLLNLGLKLGPALKSYKFVRYIQCTVRST